MADEFNLKTLFGCHFDENCCKEKVRWRLSKRRHFESLIILLHAKKKQQKEKEREKQKQRRKTLRYLVNT